MNYKREVGVQDVISFTYIYATCGPDLSYGFSIPSKNRIPDKEVSFNETMRDQ